MSAAQIPTNEAERLKSLSELGVLDSEPEPEFDALVQAAALICDVPISLISLVDTDRQWFKANIGLPGVSETPRDLAFCAHAILGDGIFEVTDAALDPRFCDNGLVTSGPGISFYAGASLRLSDGTHAGTLCVIDRQPRQLDKKQREVLSHLAIAAVRALEGRRALMAERRLLETASQAAAVLSNSLDAILTLSLDGTVTHWNGAAQRLFGFSAEEMLGKPRTALVPLHLEDELGDLEAKLKSSVTGFNFETVRTHQNGDLIAVSVSVAPILNSHGELTGATKIIRDIREQVRAAQVMADSEARFRALSEASPLGVFATDAQGSCTYTNAQWQKIYGLTLMQSLGNGWTATLHPDDQAAVLQEWQRAMALRVEFDMEFRIFRSGGQTRHVRSRARGNLGVDGSVKGYVGSVEDVTEQRRLSSEMRHRATHDSLTGLVNRGEFETRLSRILNTAHKDLSEHALLVIDLDQFKLVNDACGHSVGDQLLQQVSKLLSQTVRASDTLARLGGDEFALVLDQCSIEQAQRVAQKICDRMDDFRFVHEARRFRVGASIGLVSIDSRWSTVESLMQAADTSCYSAKEAGRNRVHAWFDTDQAMQARKGEMQWAARIEHALDENRFVLYAQRIERLDDQVCGAYAEVLVRMIDRDGSLVQPGAFLPAAERFHFASRIDRWVLRHAIDTLRSLEQLSAVDTLCVNLSGQSIGDRVFHQQAIEVLTNAGFDICERLCLEITETSAVTNITDAAVFIDHVRTLGVRIALDDFGSGASSFGYLKQLKIDMLKIDGQFIRDLLDDPLDDAAVRCFVEVARVIGVKTVAEFVDRSEVLERVRAIGVDFAQGYFLHKPEPIERVLNLGADTQQVIDGSV